ncbi:Rib/alpha-like domain-containing protein [Aerococcaceae bacterium NML180378]|nr:Rib/alpha-like domain-containing protein [Aerococcaceae bacterium NML180378]
MRRNGKANIEQRNWRSWKRGKEWVFGCSLFFTLGSASLLLSQTTAHAEHAIEDKREVPPLSTDVSDSVFDNSQETVSVNEEKTDKGNAKEFVTILESETTEAVIIEPTLTDKNELTALSQALDLEALEVAATEAIEDESEAQEEVALLESNSGLTSDGLIHIRDRYDISFTDTSPLSSRNGKGDLGFVKLNDNTIAYLYNFTEGTNKISLAELRERLILTPKSGTPGTTVHGRDTKNYYIRTDSKGKYFSNSWLGWSETDALYLVSVNTERNNHNLELNVVGTANNGDGGQGNFNRIVPLNVYSGQQITRNDINAISSNAYYTIGVHLGGRIVQGTNGRNDVMYLILVGVDNQLPTIDEAATKRNFERNLNGGALTADNLDRILQPQNIEVKDNVNRKALLLSQGHVNVAIRDEQGVERSVAEMRSLLQGPQRDQYANKTYTIVVKATDEAHAKAANSSQTITPGFTWDIVDKNPLQAALTQANNANTTASTANKTADSVAAYEQAKRDLESAKQDAQRIMTKPNASANEILDAISRVQTATRDVQTKERALTPTEASTHRVNPTTLTRSIKDRNITQQDLLNTISNLPSGARITLNGPFTLPNTVGQHPFTATIAYQDKSSQEVRITLNLTKDKRELEQALANLRTSIETEVDRENKSPLDLDAYDDNASKAQELLLAAQQLATNYNNNSVTQQQLDEKANEIIQATAELDSKREAIGYSLAYLNPISTEPVVVKKVTDAVDQYDLDVAISGLPEQPVLTLDQPFVKPATEGSYAFEGKARYHDRSWNPVVVQLILETDWTEFEAIFQPLQEALEQTVDRTNKSPKALAAYDQAKIKARELEAQFEALRASDQTKQAQINKTLETLRDQAAQAVADLTDKYNAIVEAQSVTYSVPELDILTKKVHDPVTADELLNLAAGLPGNPKVTLDQPFVKPTVEGLHIFEATATYADDSTNKVTLKLQLDLDWSEYNKLIQPLQAAVEQTVERENKSPKALAAYDQIQNTLRQVHEHLRNLRTSEPAPTQEEIDEALTTLRDNVTQAIADLAKKREAIVDSLAYQHPIANEIRLNKKVNDTIETQDLIAATNGLLGQPVVTLNEAFVKPTTEGVYRFEATALYEDDSTNRVIIQLNLETDWTAFDQAMSELNTEIRTNVDRQHKNPLAVAAYDSELEKARGIYAQLQALRQSEETNQATIDEALPTLRQEVDKIIAELQDKRSKIVPSHASTHPVATPAPIVRSIKNPASEDEILAAVTLPENAVRVEFAPDAQRQWTNVQTYQVPVNVIYQDTSVNRVMVQYTLNKDWTFLEQATNTATGRISELEQDADLLKDKRPSTVVVYRRALRNAQDKLQAAQRELQHQSVNTSQQVIDHYENQVKEALAQLNDATGKLVPSDAATHTPTGGTITRTTKTLALAQDLIAVVSNYPETASVALVLPYNIPTTKGTHIVQARVNYQDQTSETVDITYIINLDFQAINRLKAELEAAIETGHGDKKLEEQTKRSVQHYQEKLTEANSVKERLETLLADPDTQQSQLDAFEHNVRAARAHLQNAVAALTLSEATRFTPRANPLVRDTNTLATANEIANSVIVLDTYQYQLALSSNQEVPSREGEYRLRVTVTYRDESSEEVEVLYTVNTYKVRLSQANYSLNGMLGSKEKLSDKAPDTAEAYEAAWNAAQEVLQASRAIHEAANSSQQAIDEAERQSREALANLIKARDELRPSQAATYTPRMDRLEKTMRETITLSDIREHLKDIPEETEIISNPELVKREGSNFVNVTLRYPDRSTEDFGVYYYYTTVKTDLTEALNGLHTKITERPVTSDMLQSTVDAYNEVLREAERQHREDNIVLSNSSATQADLDAATERIKAMSERLAKAREGLKIKDSVTYPVQNGELTTTIKNLASDEQLLKALGDLPGGATGEIIRRYGNYVGIHHVSIQLTYPDTSTNTVQVVYTITLHKDDLANANTALEETINQEVNLENVSPKAIRAYEEVKRTQQSELNYGKHIHDTAGNQNDIDTTVMRMEQAKDRMLEAINGLVPSEAHTTVPTNGELTKTVKETVTVQELLQTIGGVPTTARVALAPGVEIPRNEVKMHVLNAVVTYQDESVDHVEIHLTLTTDLTALNREKEALESALETEEATEGKRPSTVEAYQEARQHAQEKLAAAQRVAQNPASSQESIDQATQEANQATDRLKRAAAAIVNSDATTYTPNVAELTRTMKNLALESDVFQQIAIQGATFTTALAAGVALPNSVGKHKVRVLITYNDRSTEEVEVPYTITVDTAALYQKNTDLHNAIQQSVALVDKTKASIARYESEKQRVQALLAAAQQLVQSETQDQQRIDDEVAKVHQAIQDLQAAVSQLADTQAKLIEPEVAKYSTHAKNLATVAQLTQAVTIPQTSGYTVTLPSYTDDTLPKGIGTYRLMGTVVYQDESSEQVAIDYTITPYTEELSAANTQLKDKLAEPVTTEEKRPSTVSEYERALQHARQVQAQTQAILDREAVNSSQESLDEQVRLTKEAQDRLVKAIAGLEDSDAKTYHPTAQALTRTLKNLANADDLTKLVTGKPDNAGVSILETIPQQVGEHKVIATVNYQDGTSETVEIAYTITTHKADLEGANQALQTIINREAPTDGKRQSTVDHYNQTHKEVSTILAEAQAIVSDSSASQAAIDDVLARVIKAKEDLEAAFDNIVDSDATSYTPNNGALTAKATQPATKEQLESTITVNETTNIQVLLDNAILPTEVGVHRLEATVVYADKSSEKAYVDYTILLDTDAVQAAKNKLQQKLAEYVKETDRSQATLNNYRLAKQAADNAVQASEQFLTGEVATAKQPAADAIERQLENAYAELINAIEGLRDSQASTNQPNIAKLTRTLKDAFDKQQLIDQVTELPANAYVVIDQPEAIPTTVGDYQVAATVHYEDLSTKTIAIPYEITTYTDELAEAQRQLQELVATQPELGEKSPVAIRHYQELLDEALRKIAESNEHQRVANTPQTALNEATEQLRQLKQQLADAVTNLVDAQAKLHEPQVTDLTTKVTAPVTEEQLKQQIVTQPGASVQLQLPHGAVPTTVGSHVIPVTVTYEDESVDNTAITLVIEVDPTALNEANTKLEAFLAQPVDTDMKSPDSLAAYQEALRSAQEVLANGKTVATTELNDQEAIERAKVASEQAQAKLQEAINHLVPSEASKYAPKGSSVARTMREKADAATFIATITGQPNNAIVQVVGNVPTTEGDYQVEVLITYEDRSTDTIHVPYTLRADKTDLAAALTQLIERLQQDADISDKKPDAIDAYHKAKEAAMKAVERSTAISQETNPTQETVDEATQALQTALNELQVAVNGLVPSEAAITSLTNGQLQRHVNNKADEAELKAQIGVLPLGATATIQEVPQTVGNHTVEVSVVFADRSTKQFKVDYEIILDKTPLAQANDALAQAIATEETLDDKSPATVQAYLAAKEEAIKELEATRVVHTTEVADQANVDAAKERAQQAMERLLQAAADLEVSQAAQNMPIGQKIERTMRNLAEASDLAQAIDGKPEDATVELLTEVPQDEGTHTVRARITYADQSTDEVEITYTIQTVKSDLETAIEALTNQVGEVPILAGKRPATVAEYERVKQLAEALLEQANATLADTSTRQAVLDATTDLVNQLREQLAKVASDIVDSDATTTSVADGTLRRTTDQLADNKALIGTLTDKPTSARAEVQGELPTEVGNYRIPILITFDDDSTKVVHVNYQVRPDFAELSENVTRLAAGEIPTPTERYYTPDSFVEYNRLAQILKDQLAAGQTTLANEYAPQDAVNQMKEALRQAEANFKQYQLVLSEAGKNKNNLHDGSLTRTIRQLANANELGSTIGTVPETTTFSTESALPDNVGNHRVKVVITYEDGSQDYQFVDYTITTDKNVLEQLNSELRDLLATPVDTKGKRPSTVMAYDEIHEQATRQLATARTVNQQTDVTQVEIDATEQQVQQMIATLQQARENIVDSDATTYQPITESVKATVKQPATPQALIDNVKLPEAVTDATIQLKVEELPAEVGNHKIEVLVTYPDTTTDTVTINYIIETDKKALQQANAQMLNRLVTKVDLEHMSPASLAVYHQALDAAKKIQEAAEAILNDGDMQGNQSRIDESEQALREAQKALEVAIRQLVKAEKYLYNPSADNITRTLKTLAKKEELVDLVKDIPTTATVELVHPEAIPNKVGEHRVAFRIRYADDTEDQMNISYMIRTHKEDLEFTFGTLKKLVDEETEVAEKAPLTVERYHQSIEAATSQLAAAQAILDDEAAEQEAINEAEQLVAQAEAQLKEAIRGLVDSQAKLNRPIVEKISRPIKQLADAKEVVNHVTGLPENAKVKVDEATLPTTVGKHQVKVLVQYEDLSTKELLVDYIVDTDKNKLKEAQETLTKRLAIAVETVNTHPRVAPKFEAIKQNAQQQLAAAQAILSDPNATQEAIESAEATATMIEAQLNVLLIEAQANATESSSDIQVEQAQPGVDNTGENVAETGQTHKQLPATGETDSNLLAYALTSLTGFASVVLGRKKKEEEETD